MANTLTWPFLRLIQRLSVVVTIVSVLYVVFFFLFKNKDNGFPIQSSAVPAKGIDLVSPSSMFGIKPYTLSVDARDVFSLNPVNPSGAEATQTPKGQLPDHFKIVGILIAHPSQIIIEDSLVNKTFFINEGTPQDGISIVRVGRDQMVINYQGQNISIPVNKG
jgi:hypothetical protein